MESTQIVVLENLLFCDSEVDYVESSPKIWIQYVEIGSICIVSRWKAKRNTRLTGKPITCVWEYSGETLAGQFSRPPVGEC